MSQQNETATAGQIADLRLAPMRSWASANHGSIVKVAKWLQERTGENVTRQTVGRWLSTDSDRRQCPSYGWGLLLEEAYATLS